MGKNHRQQEQLRSSREQRQHDEGKAGPNPRQPGDLDSLAEHGYIEREPPGPPRRRRGGWQDRRLRRAADEDPFYAYEDNSGYDVPHVYGSAYDRPADAHSSFRGDDYGAGAVYGYAAYAGPDFVSGPAGYGDVAPYSEFGQGRWANRNDRGFFDRARDRLTHWFGNEPDPEADRGDHRGRGPAKYTRSDQRILEDVCDNLTDHRLVDASNVTVAVKDGEVTLDGTVASRRQKHFAEECAYGVSGAGHIQNNLRIVRDDGRQATPG